MSSITTHSGTEGPRHDPYGFDELTVSRNDGRSVTLHQGLVEWIEIRTSEGSGRMGIYDGNRAKAMDAFEAVVGISPRQAERALRKLEKARERTIWLEHRHCGGMQWQDGYPGETFLMCKCGSAVDYHFNRSAIE